MAARGAGRPARRTLATVAGGVLVAGAAVVAVDVARAPSAQAASLQAFGSCEELTDWYRASASERVTAWGEGGGYGWGGDEAGADASAGGAVAVAESGEARAAADGAASTGGAVGSSETGTNVQEAGVDEPSRIKLRDGTAWTLQGSRLVAVDTVSGRVVGSVELAVGGDDQWFSELLLVQDRVVVLGSGTLPAAGDGGAVVEPDGPAAGLTLPWGGAGTTSATTVDVGDPAAMTVVDRVEVEGDYVSARASAGAVRLVTSHRPLLPYVDPWLLRQEGGAADVAEQDVGPADEAAALAHNQQVVASAGVADWLPELVERDAAGQVSSRTAVDCTAVQHPGEQSGTGTLSVLTLDPAASGTLTETTSVSADGSFVYASTDRLYVATTRGGWLWGWGDGSATTTELHGFDTTSASGTSYTGSGSVAGWLLGSWALDAQDGYLRVGTTSQAGGPAAGGAGGDVARPAPAEVPTSSSVVVLQETPGGLAEVGRVDGLGPGEQIRSLRWFDDLAVVVTFRQTDPLYTVDLSDPAAPEVLGELKVTGYSGYLHPVGDGVLLGVGQDGDDTGQLLGAKVETYDVRDLAAPTDVDRVVWPGSSSPVEWDSRLFAYLPGSRTAVLPLERYDDTGGWSTGLVAVEVSPDGALRETGSWQRTDGTSVAGVATADDLVVVTGETWAVAEDGIEAGMPTTVLTVLGAADLAVRAEVPLG